MSLDQDLKNVDESKVREVLEQNNISRRDFLKAAAIASGVGVAGKAAAEYDPAAYREQRKLIHQQLSVPEWETIVEDNYDDGVFDAAGNFSVLSGDMSDSTESGGVLYLRGPNPGADRFATDEFAGELSQICDFNDVPIVSPEFYGIQMGPNDQSGIARLVLNAATGKLEFKDLAGNIGSEDYGATINFSLKLVRDATNDVTAYICQDFNPAEPIENRVYQQLPGSTNIGGSASGAVIARYAGSEFETTMFLLQRPSPETVPAIGIIGLGVLASGLLLYGANQLRQRKSENSTPK